MYQENNKSQLPYVSLAPQIDENVDKNNVYNDALLWAIEDKTIYNIALSGIYGSGKSSILKKFQENNKEKYKFFEISLANFEYKEKNTNLSEITTTKEENNADDTNDIGDISKVDINNIEKSVLQQLLYRVDSRTIPYSRFKKITNRNKKDIMFGIALFLLMVETFVILFYPNIFENINNHIEIMKHLGLPVWYIAILSIILSIVVITIIYFIILKCIKSIKLSKITLKNKVDIEITNTEGKSESIFNKYLDEILYFFEVTDYNVVIFEDLDRFKNPEIFIKLRELNFLINKYENIKRKVVFIYAIKDDIFLTKDRTKFFDFILPVVPYLSSSNSYEILDKYMKKINSNVSKDYINDIAPFIDDMRLMGNIINEFSVYKNNLKLDEYDEKLLSIIIYKNMCPNDFSLLQEGKGFINDMLNKKNNLIEEKKYKINIKIKEYENKINIIISNETNTMDDIVYQLYGLILYYSNEIYNNYDRDSFMISTNENKNMKIRDFVNDDNIKYESINSFSLSYSSTRFSYNRDIVIDNDAYEIFLNNLRNIGKKKKILQEKIKDKDFFQNEIFQLENERRYLDLKTFAELIDELYIDETDKMDKIYGKKYKDSVYDIGKFMLRRGYIDETYPTYLSYFHPGTIGIKEQQYIMALKNQKSADSLSKLENIKYLIEKLDKRDFNGIYYLNVYMMDYLLDLDNRGNHINECRNVAFNSLNRNEKEVKEFFEKYIDHIISNGLYEEYLKMMVSQFPFTWPNMFSVLKDILEKKDLLRMFIKIILNNLEVNRIKKLNVQNCFINTIKSYEDFLDFCSDEIKLENIIDEFDIHFEYLNITEQSNIVDYIFENNYYNLNESYLEIIGKIYFSNNIEFKNANYKTIMLSDYEWLKQFINSNMEKYINVALEKQYLKEDTEQYIIDILSNNEITIDQKKKIIKKENVYFTSIKKIDNELWDFIFDNDKVNMLLENVEEYYTNNGYNTCIRNYIIVHNEILKSPIQSHSLSLEVLKDNELFLKQREILNLSEQTYDIDEIWDFSSDSIKYVLELGLVKDTVDNFNQLSDYYPEFIPEYLKKIYKQEDFDLNECKFDQDKNLVFIFKSDLDIKLKIEILKILEFDNIDNSVLLNNISYFIADFCDLDDIYFSDLEKIVVDLDKKAFVHLINSKIDNLEDEQLVELIKLNNQLRNLLIYRKQVKLEINEENEGFLKTLLNKGLISSYDKKNGKYYSYSKKNPVLV